LHYERRFTIFVEKSEIMKALIVKILIVLPILVFVNYVLMAIVGCTASGFGCENSFYCGVYCVIGKLFLVLTVIFFFFFIFQDLKNIFNIQKNVPTSEK